jgi:hypothetical protein
LILPLREMLRDVHYGKEWRGSEIRYFNQGTTEVLEGKRRVHHKKLKDMLLIHRWPVIIVRQCLAMWYIQAVIRFVVYCVCC